MGFLYGSGLAGLGFSNRWYSGAIKYSIAIELDVNLEIRLVTAPYFLATKLEAFSGRGRGDYLCSDDIADIVAIMDGRPEIIDEINGSQTDLKFFLSQKFKKLSTNELFLESVAGHLRPDRVSQARLPLILERVNKIAMIA